MAHRNICSHTETADIVQPSPRRPQTVLQRVSLILGSLPLRKLTPKQRAKSAPILRRTPTTRRPIRSSLADDDEEESLLPLELNIPTLSDEPCPNDPNMYYSFPDIEKRRCNSLLCGCHLDRTAEEKAWVKSATSSIHRGTQSPPYTPSRPGLACKQRAASKINIANRPSSSQNNRRASVTEELSAMPRTPTPLRVRFAKEVKQEASAPRFPALNTLLASRGTSPVARPPTRHGGMPHADRGLTFDDFKKEFCFPTSSKRNSPSPKLHHIFGIEDRPYIHRHEAKQYLASVRQPHIAMPTSLGGPHAAQTTFKNQGVETNIIDQDYSQTVYYPPRETPSPSTAHIESTLPSLDQRLQPLDGRSEPTKINISVEASAGETVPILSNTLATAIVDTVPANASIAVDADSRLLSLNLELEASDVYRRHTFAGSHRPSDLNVVQIDGDSFTRADTPSTLGGKRLELRGGSPEFSTPRLRGGGRYECLNSCSCMNLKLQKCILTCCIEECSSDDDEPSRIYTPWLGHHHSRQIKTPLLRLPGAYHQTRDSPVPQLRGGGWFSGPSSVSQLNDDDRLPVGLWYLAGGRGQPITVREWNRQKPRQRPGGLLGMAVYGHKAGLPYKRDKMEREEVLAHVATCTAEGTNKDVGNTDSSSNVASNTSCSPDTPCEVPIAAKSNVAAAGQADSGDLAPPKADDADMKTGPDTAAQNNVDPDAAFHAALFPPDREQRQHPTPGANDKGNDLGLLD